MVRFQFPHKTHSVNLITNVGLKIALCVCVCGRMFEMPDGQDLRDCSASVIFIQLNFKHGDV